MSVIFNIVPEVTLAAAAAIHTEGKEHRLPRDVSGLIVQSVFVRAGGGSSCKCFIQTTFDDSLWIDIMCFAYTTSSLTGLMAVVSEAAIATPSAPSTDAMADNTSLNGVIGFKLRARVVTTGTYTGASSLQVAAKYAVK